MRFTLSCQSRQRELTEPFFQRQSMMMDLRNKPYNLLTALLLLLSTFGTPVTLAEDFAEVEVKYAYTVFRLDNFTVQQAYDVVDSEALAFLENEIAQADVNLNVTNVTSSTVTACTGAVAGAPENIGACVEAEGSVWLDLDADIRYDLVEKLAVTKIQTFIQAFNQDYDGLIHIGYKSPILTSATVIFQLEGVRTSLSAEDRERLRAEILSTLRPVMLALQPPFVLTNVAILGEIPRYDNNNRRAVQEYATLSGDRQLQSISAVEVEAVLVGKCINEGVDAELCSQDVVEDRVRDVSGDNANVILTRLREESSERDYFDLVDEIVVDPSRSSIFVMNVTDVLDDSTVPSSLEDASSDTEVEEDIPWWVWILLGGPLLILAIGGVVAYYAVKERDRSSVLRQAFEDNYRQSVVGSSTKVPFDAPHDDASMGDQYDSWSGAPVNTPVRGDAASVSSRSRQTPTTPVAKAVPAESDNLLVGTTSEEKKVDDEQVFHDEGPGDAGRYAVPEEIVTKSSSGEDPPGDEGDA